MHCSALPVSVQVLLVKHQFTTTKPQVVENINSVKMKWYLFRLVVAQNATVYISR